MDHSVIEPGKHSSYAHRSSTVKSRSVRVLSTAVFILAIEVILLACGGDPTSALVFVAIYGSVSLLASTLSSLAFTGWTRRAWTWIERAALIAAAVVANTIVLWLWRLDIAPDEVRGRTHELWLGPLLVTGALVPALGQLVAPAGGARGLAWALALSAGSAAAVVWWITPR